MALSRAKSPHLKRDNFLRGMLSKKKPKPPAAPATSSELRELQAALWRVAVLDYGRLMNHVVPQQLASEIDHLIGIHVMGFEFNEDGRPDGDGDRWTWRTGSGTYSNDPLKHWTTVTDDALFLAIRYCPQLRLNVRFGGSRDGQILKAQFASKHPDPHLAGREVPMPDKWPKSVRTYPAIAIVHTLLMAMAMEKDARTEAKAAKKSATLDAA